MKHPSETELALYAGRELGVAARWSLSRHLARCAACRAEVAAFVVARESLAAAVNELPAEVNWNRLAADMKANIHVGLAAGECVGPVRPARVRIAWRAAATVAPVAVMVLLGWWLLPSRPGVTRTPENEGIVLEATTGGIELREHGRSLALQHLGDVDVTYSVNAQGALRARYVDSETGQVTINNVYVQ